MSRSRPGANGECAGDSEPEATPRRTGTPKAVRLAVPPCRPAAAPTRRPAGRPPAGGWTTSTAGSSLPRVLSFARPPPVASASMRRTGIDRHGSERERRYASEPARLARLPGEDGRHAPPWLAEPPVPMRCQRRAPTTSRYSRVWAISPSARSRSRRLDPRLAQLLAMIAERVGERLGRPVAGRVQLPVGLAERPRRSRCAARVPARRTRPAAPGRAGPAPVERAAGRRGRLDGAIMRTSAEAAGRRPARRARSGRPGASTRASSRAVAS